MADPGALNPEQQSRLGAWKIQTRIDNESYLRSHQEVRLLLSAFTREVLLHRPENIRQFAADYFTDPTLAAMIREKMSRGGGAPRGRPAPLDPCTSVPSLVPPPPSSTC